MDPSYLETTAPMTSDMANLVGELDQAEEGAA